MRLRLIPPPNLRLLCRGIPAPTRASDCPAKTTSLAIGIREACDPVPHNCAAEPDDADPAARDAEARGQNTGVPFRTSRQFTTWNVAGSIVPASAAYETIASRLATCAL